MTVQEIINALIGVPGNVEVEIVDESGRFVEVENELGASVKAGEWIDRGDGYWALRIRLRPM